MARLTNRVEKLEAVHGSSGDRRLVIPHHSYYQGTEENCTCRPYYTSTPFVIGKGLAAFYEEVNNGCPTPPSDAEFVDNIGIKETA